MLSVGATVPISRWDIREEMEWSRKMVGCPYSTVGVEKRKAFCSRWAGEVVCLPSTGL